ncbi:MAG: metal-sensitive transcriptional regulator [Acidimicrobiia bacterium]|nr:metal-sensitive transcriptional regulator [Acidimicrobiia bacterium]
MPAFPDDVQDDVQKRLRRVEGQIRGLQVMLDEGKDCVEVITQLSAAQAALDRIGYRLIGAGMRYCVVHEDEADGMSPEDLEALFLKIS